MTVNGSQSRFPIVAFKRVFPNSCLLGLSTNLWDNIFVHHWFSIIPSAPSYMSNEHLVSSWICHKVRRMWDILFCYKVTFTVTDNDCKVLWSHQIIKILASVEVNIILDTRSREFRKSCNMSLTLLFVRYIHLLI